MLITYDIFELILKLYKKLPNIPHMARLIEATVQRTAIDYLAKRYQRRGVKRRVFSEIEVRTKKKYGSKRADGLIAYKHWLWGTYVVSMEAKSYKTLPAMKPYRDNKKFILNCLWAGIVICVLSGAFFWLYRMDDGLWQFLMPFNAFAMGAIVYGFITRKHFTHKKVDVIEQVQQYPANEQWLAFSQDSLNAIPYPKLKKLKTMAKNQRIGIIIVKQKGKVQILIKPKMQWKWRNDFLIFYSREKEIRKAI